MTTIKYNSPKAIIYKDRAKHYFRKFEGFGIQVKDLIEITNKNIKEIAVIISEEDGTQEIKYTTPQVWLEKGKAWTLEDGDLIENQIILPEKFLKTKQ